MKNTILLLLWFMFYVCNTLRVGKQYGEKCTYDRECGDLYSNYLFSCNEGRCDCQNSILTYGIDANPVCSSRYDFELPEGEFLKKFWTMEECYEGCERSAYFENVHCDDLKECVCNEGYFRVKQHGCRKGIYVAEGEKCTTREGMLHLCDYRKNSVCEYNRCACFSTHYLNFTTKECVDKEEYAEAHDMPEYKAKPQDYCLENSDCMDGLQCFTSSFKCRCPGGCHYEDEKLRCDCGKVEFSAPKAVLPTGILLCSISALFWLYCIVRTIRKKFEKLDSNVVFVANAESTTPTAPAEEEDRSGLLAPAPKSTAEVYDPPPPYESLTPLNPRTLMEGYSDERKGFPGPPYPLMTSGLTGPREAYGERPPPYSESVALPSVSQPDVNSHPTNPNAPGLGAASTVHPYTSGYPQESPSGIPYPLHPSAPGASGSQPASSLLTSQPKQETTTIQPSAPPQSDSDFSHSGLPSQRVERLNPSSSTPSHGEVGMGLSEPLTSRAIQGALTSTNSSATNNETDRDTAPVGFSSHKIE